MHQIFYIDIDEEITSVVDRLKKSKAAENFFVIPARAIVLQSIVSLKLLKREADKMKKRVILVTQNQLGQAFAQKAGIEVRSSVEGLDNIKEGEEITEGAKEKAGIKSAPINEKMPKKIRLQNIGSEDFFDEKKIKTASASEKPPGAAEEEIKKPETVVLKSALMNDMLPKPDKEKNIGVLPAAEKFSLEKEITGIRKEEKFQSFFRPEEKKTAAPPVPPALSEKKASPRVSGKTKKFFFAFSAISILAAAGIASYLFVPRAKILVYPRYQTKEIDLELTGSAKPDGAENDSKTVQAQIIEKEETIASSYDSSGKSGSSSQKARGKVVIFNEFSPASQTLVATTRLLSQEGKLFRLIKGVVVPGTTSVGEEIKPGAIEAEVIADETGEGYNVGPSRFTIPGFEDGPKYEKFYAKSEKPMAGGGSAESAVISISRSDIDGAKQKTESEAKTQMERKLQNEVPQGFVLIPGAIEHAILDSKPLGKVGDAKNNFKYQVEIKSRTFIISENQVREIVAEEMKNNLKEGVRLDEKKIQVEYRQPVPDFQSQSMRFKIHGKGFLLPEIDAEKLKKDFLGKNEDEIKEILKNYPEIKEVEIDFQPRFISGKIPPRERQVEVEITGDIDKK